MGDFIWLLTAADVMAMVAGEAEVMLFLRSGVGCFVRLMLVEPSEEPTYVNIWRLVSVHTYQ